MYNAIFPAPSVEGRASIIRYGDGLYLGLRYDSFYLLSTKPKKINRKLRIYSCNSYILHNLDDDSYFCMRQEGIWGKLRNEFAEQLPDKNKYPAKNFTIKTDASFNPVFLHEDEVIYMPPYILTGISLYYDYHDIGERLWTPIKENKVFKLTSQSNDVWLLFSVSGKGILKGPRKIDAIHTYYFSYKGVHIEHLMYFESVEELSFDDNALFLLEHWSGKFEKEDDKNVFIDFVGRENVTN